MFGCVAIFNLVWWMNVFSLRAARLKPSSHVRVIAQQEQMEDYRARITKCWNPNPGNPASYSDPEVQSQMMSALDAAMNVEVDVADGHPMSATTPVGMFGALGRVMPQHFIAVMTNDGANQSDGHSGGSRCLDFDYDNPNIPDPAGCRFFKASFKPVQTMFKCVNAKLDEDPFWYLWQIAGKLAEKKMSEDEVSGKLTLGRAMMDTGHLSKIADEYFTLEAVKQQAELYREGKKGTVSQLKSTDTRLRALEMVKRVNFKPWAGLEIDVVKSILKAKIPETKTSPVSEGAWPSLRGETVSDIMTECFMVPDFLDASESSPRSYKAPPVPEDAMVLKEAIGCFPLMWDTVEVPAAPTQPLTMADNSRLGTVGYDFSGVSPLCGRVVLAGIQEQFTRARYPYFANLIKYTISPNFTHNDDYCFNPSHATCKSFVVCWTKLMYDYGYQVHPKCKVALRFEQIWNEVVDLGEAMGQATDDYLGVDYDDF